MKKNIILSIVAVVLLSSTLILAGFRIDANQVKRTAERYENLKKHIEASTMDSKEIQHNFAGEYAKLFSKIAQKAEGREVNMLNC